MSMEAKTAFWAVFRTGVACLIAGFALLSVITGGASQAPGGGWSDPSLLGEGWFPDVIADSQGGVHAIWASKVVFYDPDAPIDRPGQSEGYDTVLYRYLLDGGGWSDPYDIVAIPQTAGTEVTRPAGLIDENGIFHMTFRGTSVYYTQAPVERAASGKAWRERKMVSVNQVAYFSQLGKDSQGRLHLLFTENVRSPACDICYHVFYRQSTDNGKKWTSRSDISVVETGAAKPQLLIDDYDYLHVVWEAGRGGAYGQLTEPTTAFYTASYDGGLTWARPKEFLVPSGQAKNIAIGQDGLNNLVVAYLALPEDEIHYQVSGDQGRTWSRADTIPGVSGGWNVYNSRLDDYTMVTDSAGNLHLIAVGKISEERGTINLLHLTWNGIAWLEPEIITTYTGDMPEWPRAAISNGNQLNVVWFVRDEEHIFDSDRGEYTIWASQNILDAPVVAPVHWPTAAPTQVLLPTSTPPLPTYTPVSPVISDQPIDPNVARSISTEMDEMLIFGKALLPAAVVIVLVMFIVKLRK